MNGFGAYYEFQHHQVYAGVGSCCGNSGFRGFAFGADQPEVTVADAASSTAPTTSDGTTATVTTLKDATSTAPATSSSSSSTPTASAPRMPQWNLPAPSTVPLVVKWGFFGILGLAALKTIMQ